MDIIIDFGSIVSGSSPDGCTMGLIDFSPKMNIIYKPN